MRYSAYFGDVPRQDQLERSIESWQIPVSSARLKSLIQETQGNVIGLCFVVRDRLGKTKSQQYKSQLEIAIISWLYVLIRENVKRGREFNLLRVMEHRRADCLGYSKLFTVLGRLCGLDVGVIEVVMDNAGRLVPHTAVMVKLADGRLRLIDLWYGSQNIKHRILGFQVKRGVHWQIEDIDFKELKKLEQVRYLPDSSVDGITLYIIANRHLKNQEYKEAVKCYSEALKLYPGNPRFLYNRAIAYDKLGKRQKAEADYARALRDDATIRRVLAREHEEVIALIQLDASGIDNQ